MKEESFNKQKLEKSIEEEFERNGVGNIAKKYLSILENKFDNNYRTIYDILHNLERVWKELGDINFNDKKILDIGCGSGEEEFWAPLLSRGLTTLGAKVTGIDILKSPNEKYGHVQIDLTKDSLYEKFCERKFDIIVAQSFFDSPRLESILEKGVPSCSLYKLPTGILNLKGIEMFEEIKENFFRKITSDVYSLLNKGGIYLLEMTNFKKELEYLKEIGFKLEDYKKNPFPALALAKKI